MRLHIDVSHSHIAHVSQDILSVYDRSVTLSRRFPSFTAEHFDERSLVPMTSTTLNDAPVSLDHEHATGQVCVLRYA